MFEAYQSVSGNQHQLNLNRLSNNGYRMISLSVYGDPSDPRYAAVWVQRSGPAWVAVHGVDSTGYQPFFDTWTKKGYVPVLVTATGQVTNAVFAAVFEQGIAGPWFARHNITSGPDTEVDTFQNQNATAHAQNMILRSVTIYGTSTDRRYAAIWHANPNFVKWHISPLDTDADYQATFNAETQLPGYGLAGYRPAYVTLSSDYIYCSEFTDNVIGPWSARYGMTSNDYQGEFNKQTAHGFYPICVQGGGVGDQTRYAAIFAQCDLPLTRQWTTRGTAVSALTGFDDIMQNFMQANAVRAAQLTIAKNGVIKLARAYTWAELGYHPTQTSDTFLLASCSKIFTAAAIQSLYDANTLTGTTAVYPLLGFSHPADTRSETITIQQLLDHKGGYDDTNTGSGFDPTYSMRQIGLSTTSSSSVDKLEIARYMYARSLDFTPGTDYKYSKIDEALVTLVVMTTCLKLSVHFRSTVPQRSSLQIKAHD